MPMAIEVTDLTVHRGGMLVLDAITAGIPAGRITGLLGPSGSGKSTLIRSVVGVQRIRGGTVRVLGQPAGSRTLRARVGYVTQAPSVYADLTVAENLRYFATVLGAPRSAVTDAIEAVGLGGQAGAMVQRLSGGQLSRVSLVTALLGEPEVLVLDEPTVGLDPVLRRDLWSMFARLAAQGTTLVVSSHVMDEADRCDGLLLLREGRLLAEGSPDDIRTRTGQTDLESAFLALVDTASQDSTALVGSEGRVA